MDMTHGTYLAIQEIFNTKKQGKYPDASLLDKEKFTKFTNHDFKLLCELFYGTPLDKGTSLDEIISLGADYNSVQHLREMGLIFSPTIKISPLGKTFMNYLENEFMEYLNRPILNYLNRPNLNYRIN